MSDVSTHTESLNRERPVTEALSVLHKSFFIGTGTVSPRMYAERHDDRYSGKVKSKKRKTKVAILKSFLSLTVVFGLLYSESGV